MKNPANYAAVGSPLFNNNNNLLVSPNVISDTFWSRVPSAYAIDEPGPSISELVGVLLTGFDPQPENQDTSVVDGVPRSWVV